MEMQALGYVRNVNDLPNVFSYFVGNFGVEIDPVLDFLRSKIIVAAFYGEMNSVFWDQLVQNEKFLGIVAATRSQYPEFITSIVCGRFFKALSLEEIEVTGHIWRQFELKEDYFMTTTCHGNKIYWILAGTEEKGRTLSAALELE